MAKTDLSKKAHANKMEAVSAFIRDANLPKKYLTETLSFFRKQDVKVRRCWLTHVFASTKHHVVGVSDLLSVCDAL